MKKLILILLLIISIWITTHTKEEYISIPEESIRFRIIPNSNKLEDLFMKEKIKDSISYTINNIEQSTNIEESRDKINQSIGIISDNINNLFKEYNYNKSFLISYGNNYFPQKIYNGVKYNEGNYESMVIKVGNGAGDNYWCVLFPPLCMIEAKESDNIEYKSFVKEIINKYIKKK